MSPDLAIEVRDLGKRFRLVRTNASRALHRKIEEILYSAIGRKAAAEDDGGHHEMSELWALRNISFDVRRGEIFGVLGGNGAGKSVLLKILSRVMVPTEGNAWIRGRAGSVLQLGSVVHPELTGRENIYHGAAMLGLPKDFVDRRFDEIVEFSGLEDFLHVPMKRYSSGMQGRLMFSIFSQMETELMFIDEALSVGDEQFRSRCQERMRRLASEGRTILVVSHDMAFINNFCHRGMLLEKGSVSMIGSGEEVTAAYSASLKRKKAAQGAS